MAGLKSKSAIGQLDRASIIPLIVQDQTARAQTKRRWVASGFSLALTAATLYFVLHGIDEQALHRLAATQNRSLLVAGAVFILLQICLAGERWRVRETAFIRAYGAYILKPWRDLEAVPVSNQGSR